MSSNNINTMKEPNLRRLANSLIDSISGIGEGLSWHSARLWITCDYLHSQYPASHIASIRFYPDHFELYAHDIGIKGRLQEPKYIPVEIRTGREKIEPFLTIIKRSYKRLGGTLR